MTDVQHLPDEHRFVILHEGHEALLTYRLFKNGAQNAIDFNSTFVPPEFRGNGFAEKLVRAGIKWAKEQGYELHASCWYAAKFIR
ncbi:MAG TPA: N-acetyltransferase [Cellvibrio sp.]|uniref:GNAT family N-acetyltransferase n=1 Tax=Cellvibrio sp. TaxID=1965322 RepID=UPI000ED1A498|nr:GNAT family N-acetyltransferase [Cellvibrio sp.]HCS64564.1 N-acetyltransferase [Cellvibrio sp.]